ncbi:tubulin-specific chaperone C-like isoform X1 [Cimex lectularius]|uniref:C-CAP/cofactor C-like domain-containing protein n=1 Tax=Cimex lectularius TaxID=79782 RepID=A0A8I6TMI2_CIMLE|nr:tubulin-specific chaperone C-like isoform X1 [Cimex lectularius]XP_024084004.1 tubulin-specific chaperone C-like isoform X1 [Cimex lectularius]
MIQVPESILKRNEQRQDDLQKKKDEGPSQAEVFRDTFKSQQIKIESLIESLELIKDRNKLAEVFNQISKDLNVLNRYLATSSMFLIPYDIKICKGILQTLQDKSTELEHKLLPKKKFGFSSRKDIKKGVKKLEEVQTNETPELILSVQCGFSDHIGKKLVLTHVEVDNKDVGLARLEKCDVVINGAPNTIHLVNIRACRILCGPVVTSVLIEDCKDSVLAFACQQLRVHNTISSDFYIHVTTKAIIEDSSRLRFAPYNYSYENIDLHYKQTGLKREINNWDNVDDFNWLVNNQHSPNWCILPENERIQLI